MKRTVVVDISALGVSLYDWPVVSASQELLVGHGDELAQDLADYFAPGEDWCQVGDDLHTVSNGSCEVRLRLRLDASSWHADYFPAGWKNWPYDKVPAKYRADVAAYTDRAENLVMHRLEESDLRATAADGGPPAVDRTVRRHVAALDQWCSALDRLNSALRSADGELPQWAEEFLHHVCLDWLGHREWGIAEVSPKGATR